MLPTANSVKYEHHLTEVKQKVIEIMIIAKRYRHCPADLLDDAHNALADAIYHALAPEQGWPHLLVCNADRRMPLGGAGCICTVENINKQG